MGGWDGGKRRMRSMPVGKRRNIWGAAPSISEKERRWQNPETTGGGTLRRVGERSTEGMRALGKQAFPLKNKVTSEYGADEEWHLAIGGEE